MQPYARAAAEAAGVGDKLRLVVGRAEALPLEDGSADAVVITHVLCSVGNQAAALREALRVLRPGGFLVFLEHVAAPPGDRLRAWQQRLQPVRAALRLAVAAAAPMAAAAEVALPQRWLTAETMHVTDSAYDEAVDVHCRGSTPADVMHKYEEEAAACRERCMRLFFSCCVPAAFLWLLADAVCAAAFMYGVPLPSLWSLINAKAGVIQAALSFVLSIDAWRGHCAKRMSQAAHRRLQRLSSSSS
ncbi:methyltransferase 7A isoform X2 [Micractinium conductrix]|uniref:Methyltransferase 7A isoform X2 n=1 Tax=Micractinium conductrix TaxID=554055 RepID=A0A2P6VMU0_9CHLO|nr:methyltransferase 7A isoform X2 [Micractinium conductrix]|eukprot:PSC75365.1 methyltransferase 7A isoform X2 [Micractinium conductrix]